MIYELNSKIHFGKYKGLPIESVLKFNFKYVHWCLKNIPNFEVSEEIKKILKEENRKYDEFCINNMQLWAHGFGRAARENRRNHDSEMTRIEIDECEKHNVEFKTGYNF